MKKKYLIWLPCIIYAFFLASGIHNTIEGTQDEIAQYIEDGFLSGYDIPARMKISDEVRKMETKDTELWELIILYSIGNFVFGFIFCALMNPIKD